MDKSYLNVYFSGLRIYELDIVKCRKVYYSNVRTRNYVKWGSLFKARTLEEIEEVAKNLFNKKVVYIFMQKLKRLTVITNVMDEAEALKLDNWIRNSLKEEGLSLGREEGVVLGREQNTVDVIKKMLNKNLSYNLISDICGKSVK